MEKPATPAEWPGCAKRAMSVGGVSSGERRGPERLTADFGGLAAHSKLWNSLDARAARKDLKLPDGRSRGRVVRHGHGPRRAIQTRRRSRA